MGCQVHAGILDENKKLTQKAYDRFVAEVKDIVLNGSQNLRIRTPFPCGDPIPANPDMKPEDFVLEDKEKFPDFHKNVVVGQYEKLAVSLDMDPTFSLLPVLADPIALAGSFGVELSPTAFPAGYLPYFTGLLVPKFAVDLASAGVTDFVPPMLLIPELTKLISVPKPPFPEMPPKVSLPISPIDVPPPPAIGLQPFIPDVSLEIPPAPELPNPLKLLPEYVNVKVAMATGIPNLLVQLIAKMPQLLPKLVDTKSVFAEICAMVRDSGVFGNVEPTSIVQQASNVVLARKTSECLFFAALSQTVGTSPGSAASGVSKTVLEYDALEQPAPSPKTLTPQEKVVQWANSLKGKSYGSDPETYISKLFYIESTLGDMANETINIFGEPMSDEQRRTNKIQPDARVVPDYINTPVEHTAGFKEFAARAASEASSCGLFARSCYYAAGCNNLWFLGQYNDGTATIGFHDVGTLRNYRWVIKDPNDPSKDKINEELVELSKKYGDNINNWVLIQNTEGQFVPQQLELLPHLKPFSERALIDARELLSIALNKHPDCQEFPALTPADVLLINDAGVTNTQHVLVITADRPAGFATATNDDPKKQLKILENPLVGVDGGQSDTSNKGSALDAVKSQVYKDKLIENFEEPPTITAGDTLISLAEDKSIYNGKYFIDGESVKQFVLIEPQQRPLEGGRVYRTDWTIIDVTKTLAIGKPTAILDCNYDMGEVSRDLTGKGGFLIGESRMFLSNGTEMANTKLKQIAWIARGANFLDPRENEGEVGITASIYMDETLMIKNSILGYNKNGRMPNATLSELCFPTITKNKGNDKLRTKKDAEAKTATEKS